MVVLQKGDHLPTVAFVQALLNARRANSIKVDGDFGALTKAAVAQFQTATKCSAPNGNIDANTWNRLCNGTDAIVKDTLDIATPEALDCLEQMKKNNINPIVIGAMSNSIAQLITNIIQDTPRKKLVLLRFYGHGGAGFQNMGTGKERLVIGDIYGVSVTYDGIQTVIQQGSSQSAQLYTNTIRYSTINLQNLEYIKEILQRLKPYFHPYGSIEFHGCQVGRGVDGKSFLNQIADIVGVPASASVISQYVVLVQKFMGAVTTGCPNGSTLKEWSLNLPPYNESLP
jgi:peptidoglycan hydrolase-like protein with peptidoglycan-binding domain